MNSSHYYIITDKIIKNIVIFTLHTNFIYCATNNDNITTQADATLAPALGFSDEIQEFLSTMCYDVSEYSHEIFMEASDNPHIDSNESTSKDSDCKSSNSLIMKNTDMDSNGLQSTKCTQSTDCLSHTGNNSIVLSDVEKHKRNILNDHTYSKEQDENEKKVFDPNKNVKEKIVKLSSRMVQILENLNSKIQQNGFLVTEINDLIKGSGTFIDLKSLISISNDFYSRFTRYLSERYCNIKKIDRFLKSECDAVLNTDKGLYKIKFGECSFNALDRLNFDFMTGIIDKKNIAVVHNFAVLWHIFKFHPKIVFIITEYLTCAKTRKDILKFKNTLNAYISEYYLRNGHTTRRNPDEMIIQEFIRSIKHSQGLLRLQYYSIIPIGVEKSKFMNTLLSKGNVEKSETFEYWYKLPWVYYSETGSDKEDAHANVEENCDY